MKWFHVDKKEPELNKKLIFSNGGSDWSVGFAVSVTRRSDGRFADVCVDDGGATSSYVYWTEPKPPVLTLDENNE